MPDDRETLTASEPEAGTGRSPGGAGWIAAAVALLVVVLLVVAAPHLLDTALDLAFPHSTSCGKDEGRETFALAEVPIAGLTSLEGCTYYGEGFTGPPVHERVAVATGSAEAVRQAIEGTPVDSGEAVPSRYVSCPVSNKDLFWEWEEGEWSKLVVSMEGGDEWVELCIGWGSAGDRARVVVALDSSSY